ncbi:hypothetical protein [Segetibacter koreensis]|uniref:hypothetical protein n=1 Tax=Segetibacter koreensis TaxID=398037 RepID=UPI00036BBC84|nr:hypothetical protein [Segetibacter koreensis]
MEPKEKKSPVEIVQKLIAIDTTRKEVSERMMKSNAASSMRDKLKLVSAQSQKFVKSLLNELSQFGDAVQSEVNHEDEYHEIWNKSLANIDNMEASLLEDNFKRSENSLISIYSELLDSYPDLPTTLHELLTDQLKELKQT